MIDDFLFSRELANSFHASEDEESAFKRFLFGKKTTATTASVTTTASTTTGKTTTSKYDAEEQREINAKTEARRFKAFKNYEESCNIRGKFKVRSCPKLEECYAKNKIAFVPLASAVNVTKAATTTVRSKIEATAKPGSGSIKSLIPKFEREFLERALATRFLRTIEDADEDQDDDDDSAEYDVALKRFLIGSKTTTTAKTTTVAINKGTSYILEYPASSFKIVELISETKSGVFLHFKFYNYFNFSLS